tara:strand:+ start:1237 stop:1920 length:684 start_codon:yes stop_codon:yes gene_type:complete
MDKFTKLANDILIEQRDEKADQIEKLFKKGFEESPYYQKEVKPESPYDRSDAREYSDQMEALMDDIFDAIQKKDKQAHLAVLRKYDAIRDKAIERFGIDGPVNLIDPDLAGMYSDDFKSENGFRPRGILATFKAAIEFYENGTYGRIEGNKFIPVEPKSYIGEPLPGGEDQEQPFLSKNQEQAIRVAQSLANDPTRRSFQRDPQKQVNRAYGDVMKKIARKIKTIKI